METIEIGAVMITAKNYEICSEFQTFVPPVRNPNLTTFCQELTHISQSDVDSAPDFKVAMSNLINWADTFDYVDFGSWGYYDEKQLKQDCSFHSIPYLMTRPHRNIKVEFSKYLGVSKGYGMSKALNRLGLKLEGTHHRALDDVRNIAKIFKKIQEIHSSQETSLISLLA